MNYERDHRQLHAVMRDAISRTIGAVGLAGVALIHTIDAPSHFVGGPDTWLGVMYIALIVSSLAFAATLIARSDRRIWMAAAAMMLTAIVGFVLSRTVGLPGDSGDIGNWGEPLGIAAMFVEGSFVALAAGVLALRLGEADARSSPVRSSRGLATLAGNPGT